MFKMILASIVAIGFSAVAFADDHGAPAAPAAPAGAEKKMDAPAAEGDKKMDADHAAKKPAKKGKKEHKGH